MLPPSLPLVCPLCACSDLISSLHRQEQTRERGNTRGTSVGIEIAKSYLPPKSANSKAPIATTNTQSPTHPIIFPITPLLVIFHSSLLFVCIYIACFSKHLSFGLGQNHFFSSLFLFLMDPHIYIYIYIRRLLTGLPG